ncbi:hypothetical protein [Salinarimonas sp.]|uniref:hypothetical protein n=1 Tax=Salinarimonas sp. TaxID=2766526 RepID=UPI0032D8FB65
MNVVSFSLTKRNTSQSRDQLAYNLFRRRNEPDLYCAVPEHYPVPAFIIGDAWDFGGRLDNPAGAPRGFDPDAARHGVRLTGYYLFLADAGIAPPLRAIDTRTREIRV